MPAGTRTMAMPLHHAGLPKPLCRKWCVDSKNLGRLLSPALFSRGPAAHMHKPPPPTEACRKCFSVATPAKGAPDHEAERPLRSKGAHKRGAGGLAAQSHIQALNKSTRGWGDSVFADLFATDEAPPECLSKTCNKGQINASAAANGLELVCGSTLFFGATGSDLGKKAGKKMSLYWPAWQAKEYERIPALAIENPQLRTVVTSGFDQDKGNTLRLAASIAHHMPLVTRVYAINLDYTRSKLNSGIYADDSTAAGLRVLPLPLPLSWCEMNKQKYIRPKHQHLVECPTTFDPSVFQSKLLLLNFGKRNYPAPRGHNESERAGLLRHAAHWGYADIVTQSSKEIECGTYEMFASYKYIASPAGQGVDCFRTWEAMLLGAIAILRIDADGAMRGLFTGLPVLIVGDWKEITEDVLVKHYDQHLRTVASNGYSLEKLTSTYWRQLLAS